MFTSAFRQAVLKVHPGSKPPTEAAYAKWTDATRLMLERDGRTMDDMRELARWLFDEVSDDEDAAFWRGVCLSVPKFRQKYDQMSAKRRSSRERQSRASKGSGLLAAAQQHLRAAGKDPTGR
jgi:hypothetical protein